MTVNTQVVAIALKRPKTKLPQVPTRTRLLDAAELLFADFGYNGVSVRRIVEAACANLNAIPYHFGTKEELFKAVLLRRAAPLREERRRLLADLMSKGRSPSLEEVLWAMLEPAFRANRDNDAFRRLLGRASMDPTPDVRRLMGDIYHQDFMLVPTVMRDHFPCMDDREFYWKLNCLYGVMLFVQADTGKIQSIAGSDFDTRQPAVALHHVIPFSRGGIQILDLNSFNLGVKAMKFVFAVSTSELAPGNMTPIELEGHKILLANIDGTYYAVAQKCTHFGANLCTGSLHDDVVTCPKHGAQFNVRTGQAVGKASILVFKMLPKNLVTYPVKLEGQSISIGI